MASIWYKLSVKPISSSGSSGTRINYYFTTPGIGAEPRPITGMYESPYSGINILELYNSPTYSTVNGEIFDMIFISDMLKESYESVGYVLNDSYFVIDGNTNTYSVSTLSDRGYTLNQEVLVGDTTTAWYTLDITPVNGTLYGSTTNYFFATVNGPGMQPVTGMYNDPYTRDDILTYDTIPSYNVDSEEIIDIIFTSGSLTLSYLSTLQNPGGDVFTLSRAGLSFPYVVLGNNGDSLTQSVLITSTDNPACFNEGTQILCLNKELKDEYVRIENLRKGDLVKCYKNGYRRIDLIGKGAMINNPNVWHSCMYKMEKTNESGLMEDLIVTGGHSILVDDVCELNDGLFGGKTPMIDDKYLLLASISTSFKKLENNNTYTYYHLIIENEGDMEKRYGIWANGILTETPSKQYFISKNLCLLV